MDQEDFFSAYLAYTDGGEVPTFFHRWSALAGLGAYLGRGVHFRHGHFSIYPNMYCMLIGNPGTRKSTAIKVMKKLLVGAGYTTIAANKTSKEKWMIDLSEGIGTSPADMDSMMEQNLWGAPSSTPSECFIMADEFNNFLGTGNLDFISLLTELWDYEGTFENKIKTGKSVIIPDPTISILGGNTPTGFSSAFPTEILGQGFFSRLLLVYGEPNGRRITFPKAPCAAQTAELIALLHQIRTSCMGTATLTHGAELLIDKIYRLNSQLDDIRFESYYSRRLQHLLKLCLIICAARCSTKITERDVVYANTILTHTEHLMPKALGEFGKARHSDVSHKIMALMDSATSVISFKEIWTHVHNDLERMSDLGELLNNLIAADKLQTVAAGGFLPNKKVLEEVNTDILDYNYLTQEERDIKR